MVGASPGLGLDPGIGAAPKTGFDDDELDHTQVGMNLAALEAAGAAAAAAAAEQAAQTGLAAGGELGLRRQRHERVHPHAKGGAARLVRRRSARLIVDDHG